MKIIKCFIASPNDVMEERESINEIFTELNRNLGDIYNIRLESLNWENDAYSTIGTDGQQIINEQLFQKADLFIGIMSTKFGSPTPRASSGTEEEYNLAYKAYNENGMQVFFFFKNEKIDPDLLDLVQFSKVKDFKSKIGKEGQLYENFTNTDDFRKKIIKNISLYLQSKFSINPKKNDKNKFNKIKTNYHYEYEKTFNVPGKKAKVWVDPILNNFNEINKNSNDEGAVKVDDIATSNENYFIKAPPHFGLTCLGRFICHRSLENNKLLIYLEADTMTPYNIEEIIQEILSRFDLQFSDVDGVVIDGWSFQLKKSKKLLENLENQFKDKQKIFLYRIQEVDEFISNELPLIEEYNSIYLVTLSRNKIRDLVNRYSDNVFHIEESLDRLTNDLEALNIHRTPYNCITLLRVTEVNHDTPVNRTELIERYIGLLFNDTELPTYKIIPDLKDAHFVLGNFCEHLFRKETYEFTFSEYFRVSTNFCEEALIDLDIKRLYEILIWHEILIEKNNTVKFRFTFWLYYFTAKRMKVSTEFRNFIFDNDRYAAYPEVMEFYTGIDRQRTDAIEQLTVDLVRTINCVDTKVGFRTEINPFQEIKWNPSQDDFDKIQKKISAEVSQSNLPKSLKDNYADQKYDCTKPYNQNIGEIFSEYSLILLMQKIKACSSALRNSDYVEPELKVKLLNEIFNGWERLSKILLLLAPMLAQEGTAGFDGMRFKLSNALDGDFTSKLNSIIIVNPPNVLRLLKNELSSKKIGLLLKKVYTDNQSDLQKHLIALFVLTERPNNWEKIIEHYLNNRNKNSFYLYSLLGAAEQQYEYSFANISELKKIATVIKQIIAKHKYGIEKPGAKAIKKIKDELLPERK